VPPSSPPWGVAGLALLSALPKPIGGRACGVAFSIHEATCERRGESRRASSSKRRQHLTRKSSCCLHPDRCSTMSEALQNGTSRSSYAGTAVRQVRIANLMDTKSMIRMTYESSLCRKLQDHVPRRCIHGCTCFQHSLNRQLVPNKIRKHIVVRGNTLVFVQSS